MLENNLSCSKTTFHQGLQHDQLNSTTPRDNEDRAGELTLLVSPILPGSRDLTEHLWATFGEATDGTIRVDTEKEAREREARRVAELDRHRRWVIDWEVREPEMTM